MTPQYAHLKPNDPNMWTWDVRHMTTRDLPALISRVCEVTEFEKVGLIAHSQGTTKTLISLSIDFTPELGQRLSVARLLAQPFTPVRSFKVGFFALSSCWIISGGIAYSASCFYTKYDCANGHSPCPSIWNDAIPGFSYMFKWSDTRWDRDLRTRGFLFSPMCISGEAMWWRLGQKKHCFARQGCSLNTKEELAAEDEEDAMDMARGKGLADIEIAAWFNARVPPLALWIAGRDELVDGQRLVRRFERDREPHAEVVHLSVLDEYEHLDVLWAMDSIDM
ncbi:hypothetical protein EG328_005148 [Venturia inaequalis]|uniref:Uncharacterized protein n=1 Tax=Venturia inaequalis TaxID=5025 RepID=A0A8H3UN42_VENIN|nr:hypothetical protein EG328_005148 [Venturia inaequalis]